MFLSLSLSSCIYQDEKPEPILPKFTTLPATDVTERRATLNAIVGDKSDYNEDSENEYSWRSLRGAFVYSTSKDFEVSWSTNAVDVTVGKQYSITLDYLEPNTTYYYKFVYTGSKYSTNLPEDDVNYLWNVESFKTK